MGWAFAACQAAPTPTPTSEAGAPVEALEPFGAPLAVLDTPFPVRLTQGQIVQSLVDLGLTLDPPSVPLEPSPHGFVDDRLRRATPHLVEGLSEFLTSTVRANVEAGSLVACRPLTEACARERVHRFLEEAWRRPPATDELAWLDHAFDTFLVEHDLEGAFERALALVVESPDFLYLIERPDGAPGQARFPLDDHELASRLSYLIWDSRPDEQLLAFAAAGQLQDPVHLRDQARRMLARSDLGVGVGLRRFFSEWLEGGSLDAAQWDLATFAPRIDPPTWEAWEAAVASGDEAEQIRAEVAWDGQQAVLRAALRGEVEQLGMSLLRGGSHLDDLLTAPVAFPSTLTHAIYGSSGPPDTPVLLDEHDWPGLLTRAAVLAGRSHPTHPSPVLRGAFIAEHIVCKPPPSPPPGVPSLASATEEGTWTTNRERYELATSGGNCAVCHDAFNAYGYALEAFDAIGARRDLDHGVPVDTSVELPDHHHVDGAAELMRHLAGQRDVGDCFVDHFFRFATRGTAHTPRDREVLEELKEDFAAHDGDLLELLLAFVTSDTFRTHPVAEVAL